MNKMAKRLLWGSLSLLPAKMGKRAKCYLKQVRNFSILAKKYGQFNTMTQWSCVDSAGNPIPWYTYPMIEYISHLDFSQMNVFEFGSGNSSLWWAQNCKELISVEDDEQWYEQISRQSKLLGQSFKYVFESNETEYVSALDSDDFDVVIIDGTYRPQCAQHFLSFQKYRTRVAMLIFDNSDWYPETISYLRRELKWPQVDFHGFGPINNYTWTTTVFLNPLNSQRIQYKSTLLSIAGLGKHNDQVYRSD